MEDICHSCLESRLEGTKCMGRALLVSSLLRCGAEKLNDRCGTRENLEK
jgi:hypothetical protein